MILLFILAPIIGMTLSVKAPYLFDTINDIQVRDTIKRTILISFITTLIASFFAIPLAYLLARYRFPLKRIIEAIIDIPIVIPHSAAGIAILGLISRDTPLGKLAESLGINLVDSPIAIGIAMAFVSIPYLISCSKDAFASIPDKIEKAAYTLGASPLRTFRTISLPLAKRGIITGFVMMFARGMSEFGAIVIVAYHPMTAPVMIFDRFNSFGLDYAKPIAVILVVLAMIIFFILRYYQGNLKEK
jgi:molybdate/tungstate transport system permease protein